MTSDAPAACPPRLAGLPDRLLAANVLTAAAVLALLAVHGAGQVWLIDAVMFAYGVSGQAAGVRHIWQVTELRQIVIAGTCMATVFGFTE
ncbi:MAG TPA: hypothetical protein VMG38_01070 [Trebonia sp.]|nr:hypothetical protein [Trebonia sp.]